MDPEDASEVDMFRDGLAQYGEDSFCATCGGLVEVFPDGRTYHVDQEGFPDPNLHADHVAVTSDIKDEQGTRQGAKDEEIKQ